MTSSCIFYRWCLCHTCAFMWCYTPIAVNNNLVLHEIWAKSYFRLTKAVNLQLLIIKCLFTTLLSQQCWCILHSFEPPQQKESSLQWRHNERDGVQNHQPHDCLLKRLFKRRSLKTSKLRVTGLCEGGGPVNSLHKGPVTRKMFPFDDVIMYIHQWCLCHTCAFMWCYTPIAVNNNLVLHEIWAKSYFRLTKAVNLQLLIIKCLFTTLLSQQYWCILHSFEPPSKRNPHYNDVIMSVMASKITSLTISYSSVYSSADQRKH